MDTFNQFLVGTKADGIVIMAPPQRVLTKEEALMFAAWIIVQATDGDVDRFKAYTDAVMEA